MVNGEAIAIRIVSILLSTPYTIANHEPYSHHSLTDQAEQPEDLTNDSTHPEPTPPSAPRP